LKRLDALILKELFGPWMFGVAIFTVLIMAGTYLFRITEYFVKGVGFLTVAEFSLLLLPGIMAKTFPMAVLLATLLSFGRLSSDSEVVAMRACGTSLGRIMAPVAGFGLAVALLAFSFNELLVPGAAVRATTLQGQIAAKLEGSTGKPTSYTVFEKGKVRAVVWARDFNFAAGTLRGAFVVAYDNRGQTSFFLEADELEYKDQENWRMVGEGKLLSLPYGQSYAKVVNAWPPQIPRLSMTPQDLITAQLRDLDSFSMSQMAEQIQRARDNPKIPRSQVINLQYGYWNKITLPLAALVFALVGAPLGVRSHRTGAAAGFWIAVIIIFAYMLMSNLLAIAAQSEAMPAWVASFGPLFIGVCVGAFLIYKKNH